MGFFKTISPLFGLGGMAASGMIDPKYLGIMGGLGGMMASGLVKPEQGGAALGGLGGAGLGGLFRGGSDGQAQQAMPQASPPPEPLGADPQQAIMQKYRLWQMVNRGGY